MPVAVGCSMVRGAVFRMENLRGWLAGGIVSSSYECTTQARHRHRCHTWWCYRFSFSTISYEFDRVLRQHGHTNTSIFFHHRCRLSRNNYMYCHVLLRHELFFHSRNSLGCFLIKIIEYECCDCKMSVCPYGMAGPGTHEYRFFAWCCYFSIYVWANKRWIFFGCGNVLQQIAKRPLKT